MQFKLEQIEWGFNEMETSILAERKQLQEDASNLKMLIEKSSKASASNPTDEENEMKLFGEILNDVQNTTSDLEASREQSEDKLDRLSEDIQKFQNDIMSDVKDQMKVPRVFFKAGSLVRTTMSSDDIFVFKSVQTNKGNGFDADSGLFTAPVDGDYFFTAQMCNKANNHIYMTFVIDEFEQAAFVIGSKSTTCGTGTLLSSLTTGARVWLKATGSVYAMEDIFYRTNTFSGVLLKI